MSILRACAVAAWIVAVVPAGAQDDETPAQKLQYLHDLKGTSCSADTISLKSGPGGAIRYTVEEPASLTVIGGKLDEAGNAWAQVRNDNAKGQTGWVPLDKLSCI